MALLSFLVGMQLAWGMPLPAQPPRTSVELMKCSSDKLGTLWVSFGRLLPADSDTPTFFLTDLVHVSSLGAQLLRPSSLSESLQSEVHLGPRHLHLKFVLDSVHPVQTHLVQILRYDPRSLTAHLGTWVISEPEGLERRDFVACTVH